MSIFFTADTHFFHGKIIEFCKRPFKDAEEMNAGLIQRWNQVVGKTDTVFHVGDFAYKTDGQGVKKIVDQLNGHIHLILGNHDEAALECEMLFPFTFRDVVSYKEFRLGKQFIVLFHYGMRTWHHDLRGAWQLYGHSHGGLEPYGKSFDVGVDVSDYTPLSYERVESRMKYRSIGPHPQWDNYKSEETKV